VSPRGDSVWPAIAPLLVGIERPARYIDSEFGAIHRPDAAYRVALLYPDTYELGMANQAIAILYDRLNALAGVGAERVFVPASDMGAALRASGIPLSTLESSQPVGSCDLVGVTLPYELSCTNVLEALDLAGIPLRSADRAESDPIVMGGGPLAFNAEPLADFFDAILIGEGEEAVVEIVEAHRAAKAAGLGRADVLGALARVPGVYVPSLYEPADAAHPARPIPGSAAPAVVCKRVVADFDAMRSPVCPIVPFMDVVHDRANIEVLRGCTRGCRFCQAGMIYRPVRERSADTIVRDALAQLACSGQEELSLSSLSTTDHSTIEEVLRRLSAALAGRAVNVGLPSLRVDSFGVAMARLVGEGARGGLTFAPEAGTQRLRDVINKNVTEEELLTTVRTAFDAGWRRLKLYFMLGLPTETDDDIRGIGVLVNKVLVVARDATPPAQRGGLRIAVSVSTFVPKSHTPFQWEPQLTLEEVRHRQQVLRESMPRKGVELHWHDAEVSFVEGALARGGRELADVIEHAWRAGGGFDAWTERFRLSTWREAFEAAGADPVALASTARIVGSPLPWSHISSGVDESYLADERERALSAALTPDCSFDGCTDCGVCPNLGVDVVLAGDHRG
jgi:radical SAM family uncharacterized protein